MRDELRGTGIGDYLAQLAFERIQLEVGCKGLVMWDVIKLESGQGQADIPWEISISSCVQPVEIDRLPLEQWGSSAAWFEAFSFQTELCVRAKMEVHLHHGEYLC